MATTLTLSECTFHTGLVVEAVVIVHGLKMLHVNEISHTNELLRSVYVKSSSALSRSIAPLGKYDRHGIPNFLGNVAMKK